LVEQTIRNRQVKSSILFGGFKRTSAESKSLTAGVFYMIDHPTYSTVVEEFFKDRLIRGKANRTLAWYKSMFIPFSNWLTSNNLPDPPIESITSNILKTYFLSLSSHHNKGGVNSSYRALKALLNFYDSEYEPEWKNPIKKIKISPNRINPLPEIPISEVQKLLDSTTQGYHIERDRAILFTLVDTGCRAFELTSLNINDVNLSTGSVNILHGKGNKFRVVFLGEKGRKAVKEYLKTRSSYDENDPLFLNDEHERLGLAGLRMLTRRLYDRSNLKNYGLHAFRRCFALTMYRKTRDIFLVSRLLGHSNVEVTKRYLNLNNEDFRSIHEKNSPADMLN
jgi:integrase/recombinase XerD